MKKFLILLLALTMCIVMLPSCNKNGGEGEPGPEPERTLSIVDGGATQYTIVYAKNGESWEKTVATRLSNLIRKATGVKLEVVADNVAAADQNNKEIVIGTANNNRASTYTHAAGIGKGYAIFVDGERLILDVGSKTGAYFAVYQFIKDQFGVDVENGEDVTSNSATAVAVSSLYANARSLTSSSFPYMNVEIENFRIAHDGEYISNCLALALKTRIRSSASVTLDYVNVSEGFDPNLGYFVLKQDETYDNGDFGITVTGNQINLCASDYQGFAAAIDTVLEYRHSDGFFTFRDDKSETGNYIDKMTNSAQYTSSKYTYNRLGEYRVMFYNVLFNNSTGDRKDSNGNAWNDVPAKERNRLQALMIAEYMPDVLGCQEFNWSKRGGAGNKDDLTKLLAALGYAETVDPYVDNASNPLWNPNNSGHFVSGKPYKTYYNNTPLFYNTNTTNYIEGAYYWYKNQWDMEGIGGEHPNWPDDIGSKAATWGLFESKETGERYIVISTHMCTRSDYIRGLQAQEIVELIADLVARYNVPVFFGGDMNGNIGDANYDLFVETGYKSLQDYRDPDTKKPLASVYTSPLFSSHGYPLYDRDEYVMTPGPGGVNNAAQQENKNSIDQIFAINESTVDCKVFGVIADFCALRSSDHLPLMLDFSINS